MKRLISLLAIMAILSICFTSCVQKKTNKGKKVVIIKQDSIQQDSIANQKKSEAVVKPAPEAQKYFIIMSSFENKSNAELMQKKLIDLGYDSRIIRSEEGFYRVSYMGFSNKEEALRVLKNERAKEGSKEVWLHIPKNQ